MQGSDFVVRAASLMTLTSDELHSKIIWLPLAIETRADFSMDEEPSLNDKQTFAKYTFASMPEVAKQHAKLLPTGLMMTQRFDKAILEPLQRQLSRLRIGCASLNQSRDLVRVTCQFMLHWRTIKKTLPVGRPTRSVQRCWQKRNRRFRQMPYECFVTVKS